MVNGLQVVVISFKFNKMVAEIELAEQLPRCERLKSDSLITLGNGLYSLLPYRHDIGLENVKTFLQD